MFLEPWGEDYTLLPNDTFEIIAEAPSKNFYCHICFDKENVLVYVEGDFKNLAVVQDGNQLKCGHNRSMTSFAKSGVEDAL